MAEPTPPRGSGKAALIVFAQLGAFLAGLTLFGLLVFWLRKTFH
jgi:hypothetical protein